VAHLTRLVDDLLDVSRIARGKVTLQKELVELGDVVRQAREAARPSMEARGHRLGVRMPDEPVRLEGDPVRLAQVLLNLLDNAAKYTPNGGHIDLAARAAGPEVEISVRDNGIGIAAELLPRVFDLFQQGDRTLDRSQGGLGIGLTLVRRLVEMHGGQVTASSPGPGQGSTFTVRLPARTGTPATDPVGTGSTSQSPGGVRVLVVDDDPAVAESAAVLLRLEGHEVRCAHSGNAALELVAEFRPRVVLLDIGLPGEDGYQVARRIRQLPGGGDLMLVAVSGYGHGEAQARSKEAGFDRHLIKPVDPGTLCSLLSEVAHLE